MASTNNRDQSKELKLALRLARKNASKSSKQAARKADSSVVDAQPNRSAAWKVGSYVEMGELYSADRMKTVTATADLIDPSGVSTLYHPMPLVSEREMISATIARNPVEWLSFADTETFGFEPSAIHSFTLLTSRGNHQPMTRKDAERVLLGHTLSEMYVTICQEFVHFIEWRKSIGQRGGQINLFMHNSAKFDGIGLSRLLGIYVGSSPLPDAFEFEGAIYNFTWEIKKFGERAKIVLSLNAGKLGTFRLEVLDSLATIQRPLADFATDEFEKTETPRMFTNPVDWLREHGFDVTASDFEPYLRNAHKYEMTHDGRWVTHYLIDENGHEVRTSKPLFSDEHPRGHVFKPEALSALAFWKAHSGAEEERYAKYDTLMLANAMINFYSICRRAGITNPEGYTTSAQLGLHAQIRAICSSMYRKNSDGTVVFDEKGHPVLRWPRPEFRMAVSTGKTIYLATPEQSQHIMETGHLPAKPGDEEPQARPVTMSYDGIMPNTGYSALYTCWYTSRMSNQKSRLVQRGGRNEVFWSMNPSGTAVVACDKRSMYPAVMGNGVDLMLRDLRNQRCMALKGYVDPRVMQPGATEYLRQSGILTEEIREVKRRFAGDVVFKKLPGLLPPDVQPDALEVLNQQREAGTYDFSGLQGIEGIELSMGGHCVTYTLKKKVYLVKGRVNALKLLQARNGVFFAKLPRTACEAFRKIPVIPVSIAGSDIDSRLCFPDWQTGRLHCYVTGEELAYFLSEPTVDDESVEIDLERSWHGPILGIAPIMGTDRVTGMGESPFTEYVDNLFGMRQEAIQRSMDASNRLEQMRNAERAGTRVDRDELRAVRNELRTAQLDSVLIKNLLNAGGYGVQAQNITPEYDESSENVDTCLNIIKKLSVQDPDWTRVNRFVRDAIATLNGEGFFKKQLRDMNELWVASGMPMEMDFTKISPTDQQAFKSILMVVEANFGSEAIETAESGSSLQNLVLRIKSLAEDGGWESLLVWLRLINKLTAPKIEVVRDCERKIMAHATSDEGWLSVIKRLDRDVRNDALAQELLIKTHPLAYSSEADSSIGLSRTWDIVVKRMRRASKNTSEATRIYAKIMQEYAAAHMLKYSSYTAHEPGGRDVERFRMTLMEETANHAIRPWAVSITAKARVLLHTCMRTMMDLGFEVLYCDTDCVYVAVPHSPGIDPVEAFKTALENQKTIKIGTGLADWSIEHKYVQKGYEADDWKAGDRIIAEKVLFLGKKVIMFCDDKGNVLDVRASGISLANPLHRAALYSYAEQSVGLGDKMGIRRPPPVEIDRLRMNEYGEGKESNQVRGLYANATRMFYAGEGSTPRDYVPAMSSPALLSLEGMRLNRKGGLEMTAKELGERYSVSALARNNPGALRGCDEAASEYLLGCRVAGKPISELRQKFKEEFRVKCENRRAEDMYYEQDDEFRAKIMDQLA